MTVRNVALLLVLAGVLVAAAACVVAAVRAGAARDPGSQLSRLRCGWVLTALGLVTLCLLLERAPAATINSDPEDCGPAVVGVVAGTGNDPECIGPVRRQVEWAGGIGGAIVLVGGVLVATNHRRRPDSIASAVGSAQDT